ncbi:hypothetical protein [Natronomonas sp. EA1]
MDRADELRTQIRFMEIRKRTVAFENREAVSRRLNELREELAALENGEP